MKRTGLFGTKFATRRQRFGALSAAAVLLVIPAYGAHDAEAKGRTEAAPATAANARVGALFSGGLDSGHNCTASVVRSAGHDIIVTAAHCLPVDESEGGRAVFAPGYRDGSAPYGTWPVESVYEDDSWTEDGDQDSDVAFAVLGAGSEGGRPVQDVVGAAPLFAGRVTGEAVTVTGYPSDTEVPQVCTNTSVAYGDAQQRIDCPAFPSGTSGSPWVVEGGAVAGVIGGYQYGGDDPDVSYSIVFGPRTKALFQRAEAAGTPAPAAGAAKAAAAPEPTAGGPSLTSGQSGAGAQDGDAGRATRSDRPMVCACLTR
ncbi:trypsin-like serine peptidase [Streptomyces sp. NPDC048111]|uniref:trypsin-like serine peptidase n=1 Tax=Streptomyces sp. NPDC048111 TaxID=3365500 RepID=UPI00371A0533